jgi:hypothetical protein
VVGFAGAFRLSGQVPYKTTLFDGRLDAGDRGIRIIGLLWLLAAVAFGVAAVATVTHLAWWPSYVLAVSAISLVMCLAGWPDARIGAVVNVALISFLLIGSRAAWLVAGAGRLQ